jgi:hypothetical protein
MYDTLPRKHTIFWIVCPLWGTLILTFARVRVIAYTVDTAQVLVVCDTHNSVLVFITAVKHFV